MKDRTKESQNLKDHLDGHHIATWFRIILISEQVHTQKKKKKMSYLERLAQSELLEKARRETTPKIAWCKNIIYYARSG